jgi:hypothetical protein
MIQLKSFDLAFHFSFNQNKLWTNCRSNRALLYNKPSILYQWKYICPSYWHVWESDFFHLSRRTTVIQDLLVRRQFSLVPDKRLCRGLNTLKPYLIHVHVIH